MEHVHIERTQTNRAQFIQDNGSMLREKLSNYPREMTYAHVFVTQRHEKNLQDLFETKLKDNVN